ncbi:hypothetical protein K435DRAFT_775108 [Dendrothele bispora CBS 962.96]|uniref:CoA-dependent acyltransferase n=1 Tax=Dendrothele bispora (strain CBS 962.96) TaxID=1314807 RepID=A0A4S8MKT9_DENBC|nr:hypothetical protein K435DRAFT_775108 [Dendrothele bispora CBS 962.96]
MTDLYFTSQDGIHYSRRLHGRERLSATNTHFGNGFGQIVALGDVELKTSLTQEQLAPYVKAAWIQTRFIVPWMAIRTSNLEAKDNSFLFTYEVPKNQAIVDAWANKTIVWRPESLPFAEWETLLKATHWKPGDNRHAFELHIAALPDGHWMMALTTPHWVADGRGTFPVIDQYYKCLQAVFEGSARPTSSIEWGSEVIKLPPTGIRVVPDVGALPDSMEPPPSQFLRYTRQPRDVKPNEDVINRCIVLTRDQTDAFNSACKRYKCSITAAINAVFILADVETDLRCAANEKGKVWEEVRESFNNSAFFTVMVNVSDLRHFIYPLFSKVSEPVGMGGLINCVFPTYHDMSKIRDCIQVNPDGNLVKNYGPKTFWDGLVVDTRNVLKEGLRTKASPRMYHQVSTNADAASSNVKTFALTTPGVMASSLGNLQKLSWFSQFCPSVATSNPRTVFSINQWAFGIRTAGASTIVINTWEYDGILSLNLQASSRWQTKEAWDCFANAIIDAFERITFTKAAL